MTFLSHPDSGVVLVTGLHCHDCHFTPRQRCVAIDGSPLWWLSFHTQTVVWCYWRVSTVMTVISHPGSGVVLLTGLYCDDCHFTPRQWCGASDGSPLWLLSFHTQTDSGVVLVTGLHCDDCHFTPRQWCGAIDGSPLWWLSFHTQTDSGVVLVTGLHCDDCHFTPGQTVVWC